MRQVQPVCVQLQEFTDTEVNAYADRDNDNKDTVSALTKTSSQQINGTELAFYVLSILRILRITYQIFPSPIDFHRRPYNTLALPCERVMGEGEI